MSSKYAVLTFHSDSLESRHPLTKLLSRRSKNRTTPYTSKKFFSQLGELEKGLSSNLFRTVKDRHADQHWVLRKLENYENVTDFIQMTEKCSSLFAAHQLVDEKSNNTRQFLACQKNQQDLLIHLAFYQFSLSLDVLIYLIRQGYSIVHALNDGKIAIGDVDLLDSFQIWENPRYKFEIRYGSFARFNPNLPEKSINYREQNLNVFRKLLSRVKSVTEELHRTETKWPARRQRLQDILWLVKDALDMPDLYMSSPDLFLKNCLYRAQAVQNCLSRAKDIEN